MATLMHGGPPAIRQDLLLTLLLTYATASFLHHVHNARFLGEYPNMPAWLSPARVYGAWLAVTAVGLAGFLLSRSRFRRAGLIVLGVYGCFGLGGLGHYAVAPVTAHTLAMNLTICFEVVTAVALVAATAIFMRRLLRHDHEAAQS